MNGQIQTAKGDETVTETASTANLSETAERVFTLQELAQHDGQNGSPAYIAINGDVYDVTKVQLLKDGRHHGVTAGNDVTDLFVHKQAILNRLQIIGKLA
ncbi:MAG: cytochrome b5 domain-containing protein [Desulfuromonadaceae bacterium]